MRQTCVEKERWWWTYPVLWFPGHWTTFIFLAFWGWQQWWMCARCSLATQKWRMPHHPWHHHWKCRYVANEVVGESPISHMPIRFTAKNLLFIVGGYNNECQLYLSSVAEPDLLLTVWIVSLCTFGVWTAMTWPCASELFSSSAISCLCWEGAAISWPRMISLISLVLCWHYWACQNPMDYFRSNQLWDGNTYS